MPTFRWKGRTVDGHAVNGELAAPSKEEVLRRLREQRIQVSSITESEDFAEPGDPDVAVPPSREPRRIRSMLIALAFAGAAAAVSFFTPLTTYRCDRMPNGRVDCTITEHLLGVYPLRSQTLTDIAAIDTDSKSRQARIIFTARNGQSIHTTWNEPFSTDGIRNELSSFAAGGRDTHISRWQVPRVPALISAILLVIATALFAAIILSFFTSARGWAERVKDVRNRR